MLVSSSVQESRAMMNDNATVMDAFDLIFFFSFFKDNGIILEIV